MMKELSISLTLAGLIGLSSFTAQQGNYGKREAEAVEIQSAGKNRLEKGKKRTAVESDPYKQYINTLEVVLPFIHRKDLEVEGIQKICDEEEIRKKHTELLKRLAAAEAALPTAKITEVANNTIIC